MVSRSVSGIDRRVTTIRAIAAKPRSHSRSAIVARVMQHLRAIASQRGTLSAEKSAWGVIWTLLLRKSGTYYGGERSLRQEATMNPRGASFQPELIELMRAVLDEAALPMPEPKRTSAMKAELASHILACAAKGERDPAALKMSA